MFLAPQRSERLITCCIELLKLLKEANHSELLLNTDNRMDGAFRQRPSAISASRKRFPYAHSKSFALSEQDERDRSKIGSNISKLSERGRLDFQAERMDHK